MYCPGQRCYFSISCLPVELPVTLPVELPVTLPVALLVSLPVLVVLHAKMYNRTD